MKKKYQGTVRRLSPKGCGLAKAIISRSTTQPKATTWMVSVTSRDSSKDWKKGKGAETAQKTTQVKGRNIGVIERTKGKGLKRLLTTQVNQDCLGAVIGRIPKGEE